MNAIILLFLAIALPCWAEEKTAATSQKAAGDSSLPVIVFDECQAGDAVAALGKQAGLHLTLDPALPRQKELVVAKWRNVSAEQAIEAFVNNFDWKMTPAAGEHNFLISAGELTQTAARRKSVQLTENAPAGEMAVPISLDHAPIKDAIGALANAAEINFEFSPQAAAALKDEVTVKWDSITARKALQTILDKHHLKVSQLPGNPIYRIGLSRSN